MRTSIVVVGKSYTLSLRTSGFVALAIVFSVVGVIHGDNLATIIEAIARAAAQASP